MSRPPATMYMEHQEPNSVPMIDSFKSMTIQQQQHTPYNPPYSQIQQSKKNERKELVILPIVTNV